MRKGTKVLVKPTAKGLTKSYPATKWLQEEEVVTLLEHAPNVGSLDVIEVKRSNGDEEAIYDFNIVEKVQFEVKEKRKPVIHYRDIRLSSNAGMDFPLCYANAKLLDTDKGRLSSSGEMKEVTCKRCLKMFPKRYPWAVRGRKK